MNRARNIRLFRRLAIGMILALAPVTPAVAQPAPPPSAADFAKLQKDVADQRQLMIQMLQMEQQRYDMLLKLLQAGGQVQPGASLPPSSPLLPSASPPEATTAGGAAATLAAERAAVSVGVVSGHVQAKGGALKEAYVYVDQVRGSPARGHVLEVKQKDKQFSPQVAVVQRGTKVVFPNYDAVFHNVFSPSGRNTFDLGSYRNGDPARSVVLTTPGVVDVFCNIHSRMNATILVVPSSLYTRVRSDGSFRLDNVPVGVRHLVAWSPGAAPAYQKVDLTLAGAQASFLLEYESPKAHANKLGQPYGSYKE